MMISFIVVSCIYAQPVWDYKTIIVQYEDQSVIWEMVTWKKLEIFQIFRSLQEVNKHVDGWIDM